jgi:hypothetical protein
VDNTGFIDSLQQLGFSLATCSQSNYTRTLLSLTSTFNMEYLQTLHPHLAPNQNPDLLIPELKHNIVRQQLEQLGYKTIVFKNPWGGLIWDDAAIVYRAGGYSLLTPYEYLLLSTTVARVYLDRQALEEIQNPYYTNYVDTLYALEQLQKVPSISGPKFVFVHLVIPHGPFVFGPSGEMTDIRPYDSVNNLYTWEDEKRGSINMTKYINSRMLEIIPMLIQESRTPPIIILASDHGAPFGDYSNAVKNLEAIYVPGNESLIYKTITPVNIFRVLFNKYFNGNFDLLPDRSYFSASGQYFNFEEIPNVCGIP